MPITSGSRLGPFEISKRIGVGGMGEVWAATDARLNRSVAIKVLPEDLAGDPERLRRFTQEARAAGALNHPNLVTIYDVGTEDGTAYVAMELLEGETLRDKIGVRGGSISSRKVVEYAAQIANGLAAAHEKGIVHRDLKPENIFITEDGRLKILDFGLAKVNGSREGSNADDDGTQERHTSPGTVLGTAGYMSPEQVRGRVVDHRTDIFAFGVVTYEMLSGRRAFTGDSAADMMSAILKEDPPSFDEVKTPVQPGLERIVRRCIEKVPAERFQSAHDIAYALDAVSSTSASRSMVELPSAGRKARAIATMTAVGLASCAITAAIVWRMARRGVAPAAAASATSRFVSQLTFDSGERMPSLSADGKTFAFTSDAAGRDDIYVQRVDGRNAINLTKDASAASSQPAFSPDGEHIAFRSERDGGGIFVMGATGESTRRLSDIGFNPAWSPDGKEIVIGTNSIDHDPRARSARSSLFVIDVRSGSKRQMLKAATTSEGWVGDGVQPAWSPHGKRIACWGIYGNGGQRDLWTVDPHAAEPAKTVVRLTNDSSLDWSPLWSADGKWLYFGSDRGGSLNLWRMPMNEDSGQATGPPAPVSLPSLFAGQFTLARNTGDIAFASFDQANIMWRVPFDPVAMRVTGDPVLVRRGTLLLFASPNSSPDGEYWVFSNAGAQEDLYVMKYDGTGLRQLTNDPEKDRGPSFSADGKDIYFYAQRGERYELYAIHPDGSGMRQLSNTHGRSVWYPMVMPGRNALLAFNEDGTYTLPFDADGKITRREALPPIDASNTQLKWPSSSSDGSMIVGVVSDTGPMQGTWIYSTVTHKYQRVGTLSDRLKVVLRHNRNVGTVRWVPNSNRYILEIADHAQRIVDVISGTSRDLNLPLRDVETLSFTPDGKTILLVESYDPSSIWMMHGGAE